MPWGTIAHYTIVKYVSFIWVLLHSLFAAGFGTLFMYPNGRSDRQRDGTFAPTRSLQPSIQHYSRGYVLVLSRKVKINHYRPQIRCPRVAGCFAGAIGIAT